MSLPGSVPSPSQPLRFLPWPAALALMVWDEDLAQVFLKWFKDSSIAKIRGSLQSPTSYWHIPFMITTHAIWGGQLLPFLRLQ